MPKGLRQCAAQIAAVEKVDPRFALAPGSGFTELNSSANSKPCSHHDFGMMTQGLPVGPRLEKLRILERSLMKKIGLRYVSE